VASITLPSKKRGRPKKIVGDDQTQTTPRKKQATLSGDNYTSSKVENIYDPIYNTYNLGPKTEIKKPIDWRNHWINDRNHENWLRYWHLFQQQILTKQEFFKTGDRRIFDTLEHLNEAERKLIEEQKIAQYEVLPRLVNYYTTNNCGELRYHNPLITTTFYQGLDPTRNPPTGTIDPRRTQYYPPNSPTVTSDSEYLDELRPIIIDNTQKGKNV
jgi:hypothetical protein